MTGTSATDERARASVAELRARMERSPALLEALMAGPAPVLAGLDGGVVMTGVGMSEGVARFVATVARLHGVPAQLAPLSAFLSPAVAGLGQHLVLFSQELSPNAWFALDRAASFSSVTVVTAVSATDERLATFVSRGGRVVTVPPGGERGLLVRVMGPRTSALAGLLGVIGSAPVSPTVFGGTLRAAFARGLSLGVEDERPTMLTEGVWTELGALWPWTWMEALWVDAPPLCDALHFVHGAWQARHGQTRDVLCLEPPDATPELWQRLDQLFATERHRVHHVRAALPGPLAFFEFAALLDGVILSRLERRPVDLLAWPGLGSDAPLYGWRGR